MREEKSGAHRDLDANHGMGFACCEEGVLAFILVIIYAEYTANM